VYDGENASYLPSYDTEVNAPINAYGRTKLSFEKEILSRPRSVVLRLSNIIGPSFAYCPAGMKFLEWLYEAYKKKEYVGLRHDEYRSFVFVGDVVKVIVSVMKAAIGHSDSTKTIEAIDGRIFNVGGPKGLSRLELSRIVANCRANRLTSESDAVHKKHRSEGIIAMLIGVGILCLY
jgi:dTDP-4-dehydrorhamnose reductase